MLYHPPPRQRFNLQQIPKNNNRSPAAKIKINETVPLIKFSNSIQKNSTGITNSTSLKLEYKKQVLTGDINHTKKKHVGHHRKRYSKELVTDNDITTTNIQKIKRYPISIISNLAKANHHHQ